MSLTSSGKATTSATAKLSWGNVLIRPGRLTDSIQIGRMAAKIYVSAPLTVFLYPRREKYYADYERGFIQRSVSRMLSPRNVTYVACTAEEPGRVLGYAQFLRLGDDVGARNLVRELGVVKRVLLWVLGWLFWAYCLVWNWVLGGDRAVDKERVKKFEEWRRPDQEKYWGNHEERANRWYVQSCVVPEEYQRKGIGKRLMEKVVERAEREGVVIGLEASVMGEGLYRKLGFELLARFNEGKDLIGEGDAGGLMMWSPDGWREKINGQN